MLKNMESVVVKHVGIEKIRVVKNTRFSIRGHKNMNVNEVREGDYAAALALIEQAEENCCGGEVGDDSPELFPTQDINDSATQSGTTTETAIPQTIFDTHPEPEPEEEVEEDVEEPEEEQQPKEKKPSAISGLFKKVGNFVGRLVNED